MLMSNHLIFLVLVNAVTVLSRAYAINSSETLCELQKSISIHTAGCLDDGTCPFGNLENSHGVTIVAGRSANPDFTMNSCAADPDRILEPVGGASKFVTTIIMMKLVEENVLSLDDPLSTWFDWWATDPSDNRSRITLRHLLSMTSGFGYVPCAYDSQNQNETNHDCAKKIYDAYGHFAPGRLTIGGYSMQSTCFRPNNMTDGPDTILPGQYFCYDESQWNIAVALALQVTGMDLFNDVYVKYLATPLGINASQCNYNSHHEDALLFGGTPRNVDGGSDLSCTLTEYSKILGAYFAGGILSNSSTYEMERVQTTNLSQPMSTLTPVQVEFMEQYTAPEYGLGLWHASNGTKTSPSSLGVLPLINREVGYWALVFRDSVQGDQESIDAVYRDGGILSKLNNLYNNTEESESDVSFAFDSCSADFNCSIANPLGPCPAGFCAHDDLQLIPQAMFIDFQFSRQNCGERDALIRQYYFGFQCEFLSAMRQRSCCYNASIANDEPTATTIQPTASTMTPANDEGTASTEDDGALPPYMTDTIASAASSRYTVRCIYIIAGIVSLMMTMPQRLFGM